MTTAERDTLVTAGIGQAHQAVWYVQQRLGLWRYHGQHPLLHREDLRGAAYVGLVQATDVWDGARAFAPLAYFMSLYAALNYVRAILGAKKDRRRPVMIGMAPEDLIDCTDRVCAEPPTAEAQLLQREQRRQLVEAARALTHAQRTVVAHVIHQQDTPQSGVRALGRRLGVTEHAVMGLRRRGFARMRRVLASSGLAS